MSEVRTTGSWLIIWLSALALGALLWFGVVKQFDNGIQGAVSALFDPAVRVASRDEDLAAPNVGEVAARTPVFALDMSGQDTEVRAELPKGELSESVWSALEGRSDAGRLKVKIAEYESTDDSVSSWTANLPDFINKLPEQTPETDLHLFVGDGKSTLLGKATSAEESEQLATALRELAPNTEVSMESLKLSQEEAPVLVIEKNGGVLELKGQLASEYLDNDFAGELKKASGSTELIDSLRYSSEISNNASELNNIEGVVKLLSDNGSRAIVEVKEQKYSMQLFGYSGDDAEGLRGKVSELLGDVPFELAVGAVGVKEVELVPEAPVEKSEPNSKPTILAVNFGFNSFTLTPESDPALSELLERMWANPELNLVIEGHTDSTGSPVSNQLLSQQRADAVKNHLVESGITATRLKALGFGDEKPISSNKTSEGRFKNRRIEVREQQIP